MKSDLIKRLGIGAFIGCFMVMLVMVLISFSVGPEKIMFTGSEIINAFFVPTFWSITPIEAR